MINISDTNKQKWKSFERYIQYEVVLSYVIDRDTIGIFPANDLYPADDLYPISSQQTINLTLTPININLLEEIDVTTSSIPSNKLSIKVNNADGLFDEFSENSIVQYLTNDTNVNVYVKLDEDNDTKILISSLKYDSVSTNDDLTANIVCYGSFNKLRNIPFRYIGSHNNTVYSTNNTLSNYLESSYSEINWEIPTSNMYKSQLELNNSQYNTLYDVLWQLIVNTLNGFWINDRYDKLRLVNRRDSISETITKSMQLEKAKLTKELQLTCVKAKNSILSVSKGTETGTFSYEYQGKLINQYGTSSTAVMGILITNDEYYLSDLTTSDITLTNCSLQEYHIKNRFIFLLISGAAGDSITITINKNLSKIDYNKINEYILGNDSENFIEVNDVYDITNCNYFDDIINVYPISIKVKTKIMGLPYLELGDVICIETDYGEKIVNITKINSICDGGYTMEIEGYSTDYEGLFPSDSLYPSDTLYPNMRIE